MKKLRISFSDSFQEKDLIIGILSKVCDVGVVDSANNPDILFFSSLRSEEYLECPDAVKVYITREDDVPDFNICDYGVSSHFIRLGDRSFRLPAYCYADGAFAKIRAGERIHSPSPEKRGFCSVVIDDNLGCAPERMNYWNRISQYRKVDSGGKFCSNVECPVSDRYDFMSRYKFNLAFESGVVNGCTSEKITDAFYAGTVPIYWGNRQVGKDFNPEAFININDFASIEEAVEYIRKVDEDDDLYLSYLRANPLVDNPMLNWEEDVLNFLVPAIEGRKYLSGCGVPSDFNNPYRAARIRKWSNLNLTNDNKWLLKAKEGIHKIIYRKNK